MSLELTTERHTGDHDHENAELLLVIEGGICLQLAETAFEMAQGDFVVINQGVVHSYHSKKDVLLCRVLIAADKIAELSDDDRTAIICCSVKGVYEAGQTGASAADMTALKRLLGRMISEKVRTQRGKKARKAYYESLCYQLLDLLIFKFSSKDDISAAPSGRSGLGRYDSEETDERIRGMMTYIRGNFRNAVSLQDLADRFYMNPTYVSKYIKKKTGMNFGELINEIRLSHAVDELVYTDTYVTQIALDNGFASLAAFGRAFRDKYGTTPAVYRNSCRKDTADSGTISEKMIGLAEAYASSLTDEQAELLIRAECAADAGTVIGQRTDNTGLMINAGSASDLTKTAFQNQILESRDKIGIKYVCFWDIYSPDLMLDIHAGAGEQNYSGIDTVTDFLVSGHLKPYIELSKKPVRLLKNTAEVIKSSDRRDEFASDAEAELFFSSLIRHMVRRYGAEEVQSWYFDLQELEALQFNLNGASGVISEEGHEAYFHSFDIIAGALRQELPGIRIGGGEFPYRHYGEEGFARILKLWSLHAEKPDFITITSYPYILRKADEKHYEEWQGDVDSLVKTVEEASGIMESSPLSAVPLHVMEYSLTLSNRNPVNDSCIKAAYLAASAIGCGNKAQILGHWLFSDIYADYRDSMSLLFGGTGLLTKNGIAKPSYRAAEFLHSLYGSVFGISDNCIITGNGQGSFRIVCHSLREIDNIGHITEENRIHIKDLEDIQSEKRQQLLQIRIRDIRNGVYSVKQRFVNEKHGSIQNEWNSMNMETDLSLEELDYLRAMSVPRIEMQNVIVSEGTLLLDITMEPNEVRYIYITAK